MGIRRGALAIFLICAAVAACGRVDNTEHVEGIKAATSSTPAWIDRDRLGQRLWTIERTFYETRGYLPAWIDGVEPTPVLTDLIQQLRYSERHGLDPARYGAEDFAATIEKARSRMRGVRLPVETVPELDARLTYAYLRYAADLLGWTSSPTAIDPTWRATPRKEDLAARLERAIASGAARDSLEELAPAHPQYKGLQAALMSEIEAPAGHADTIRMNLERWRWAPRDLGDRYILINVPAYQLQVMEGTTPALAMRVIVGDPENQTPIFSDQMTYVVFSPYWNIPESILREETLPRVAGDPAYLDRNNIEVVGTSGKVIDAEDVDWGDEEATKGLRFRQTPGPDNALGLVKFIFPNNFSVYLHDTPSDKLFFRDRRALSHGCIRVEDPVALARYVMADRPEWTESKINAAMHAKSEQHVRLKTPLQVHIGYWTAWVEPDGKTVTYTDDPYGFDQKHAQALARNVGVR
jgi:murein L,D-transpeptidase YcbB/YkuD